MSLCCKCCTKCRYTKSEAFSQEYLPLTSECPIAEITSKNRKELSGYSYIDVTSYNEYSMPTNIHELSSASATFQQPVSSKSDTLWRSQDLSDNMNDNALLLQSYCTNAGLTPLASEWWHFNDLTCYNLAIKIASEGNFNIEKCYSRNIE